MFWLAFPAILKGWFERVFAYGDAYALTPEGWQGEVKGRVPLLHHEKALVISTTLFSEADYQGRFGNRHDDESLMTGACAIPASKRSSMFIFMPCLWWMMTPGEVTWSAPIA